VEATVSAIEYYPGRTARLALLLEYKDEKKNNLHLARWVLKVGTKWLTDPNNRSS